MVLPKKKGLIYLITFLVLASFAFATVITDCTELQAMTISGTHELGNDIDCTGFDFTPIASPFSGTFDGKGFDILNLNVNVTGVAGLFERCQNSGYDFIHNFTMTNPYIESSTSIAGAVCGNVYAPDYVNDITVYNGTVKGASNTGGICSSNCYLKNVHYNGYVSTTNNNVGGLLSIASTAGVTVTNCSTSGTVESFDLSSSEVGGLIGDMASAEVHVYSSWSNTTVIGLTDHVGGITGQSLNIDSSIENSYFTGHISAPTESGGIQGVGVGLILNSYVNATFSGALTTEIGGIIGHDSSLPNLNVTNSFAISNLTGVNGLIMGRCQSNLCNIDGNYAYNDTQNTDYIVASGTYTGTNYPITTQSYFTDTTNAPMSSWDFTNVWQECSGELPKLMWETCGTIEDTTPPNWNTIPSNKTIGNTQSLLVNFNATDNVAIDTYFLNDTTNFKINSNGTLENNTNLSIGYYEINISVNDTSNNIISTTFSVNVTLFVPIIQSNLTNLQLLIPSSIQPNIAFDVNYSFDCTNDDTPCYNSYINITTVPITGCSIQSGNENLYYGNIPAGTSITNTTSWLCSSTGEYMFNITAQSNNTNNILSTTSNITVEVNGLTSDQTSCLLYGTYVNGTVCANGETIQEVRNMSIILGLGIIALLLAFATWYMEDGLKFAFMLATGLFMLVMLRVIAAFNTNATIVNLLETVYIVGLIGFLALFFYVLVKFLMELKAKKTPPPDMGSPLQKVKADRKAKKQWQS